MDLYKRTMKPEEPREPMSGFIRTGEYSNNGFSIPGVADHIYYPVLRMSGLWGYQSALDLYLRENGIKTLFFSGVNTDQVRCFSRSFCSTRRSTPMVADQALLA
jgi:hypothetical protein